MRKLDGFAAWRRPEPLRMQSTRRPVSGIPFSFMVERLPERFGRLFFEPCARDRSRIRQPLAVNLQDPPERLKESHYERREQAALAMLITSTPYTTHF